MMRPPISIVLTVVIALSSLSGASQAYETRRVAEAAAYDFYTPAQRRHTFTPCADQFPSNKPLTVEAVRPLFKATPLCSNGFAVLYSPVAKAPMIVIERLSSNRMKDAAGEERTDNFYPDPRLEKGERAELSDFRGSGYDRGHLSPAANARNQDNMNQTFALTNMVMQNSNMNRKPWAGIERAARKFASRAKGDVFVYTGPIFSGDIKTMGKNKVWIPSHLFKLVYDQSSGRAWAWVLENADGQRVTAPIDYPTFVNMTGLRLLSGHTVTGGIK